MLESSIFPRFKLIVTLGLVLGSNIGLAGHEVGGREAGGSKIPFKYVNCHTAFVADAGYHVTFVSADENLPRPDLHVFTQDRANGIKTVAQEPARASFAGDVLTIESHTLKLVVATESRATPEFYPGTLTMTVDGTVQVTDMHCALINP